MGDSDSDSDRSYDYLDYDEEDNTPRSPGSPTAQDRRARVNLYYGDWPEEYKAANLSVGFQNPVGVSCYRNCALAVLLHLPVFVNFVKMHVGNKWCPANHGKDCLICALAALSKAYWSCNTQSKEIVDALERVRIMCQQGFWHDMDPNQQQDSSEFLTRLFHALRDISNGDVSDESEANWSHVSHMFFTIVKERDTCRKCGRIHYRGKDVRHSIGANIIQQKEPSIEMCLEASLGGGELTGRRCETCEEAATWDTRTVIRDAPEVLLVQINRAVQNSKGQMVRDPRKVSYGEDLDLTQYLENHASDSLGESLQYKLNAVVLHKGYSLKKGHYICYTVGPTGVWSRLDDTANSPATLSSLDAATSINQKTFAPYMLVYARQPLLRGTERPKRRRSLFPMLDLRMSTDTREQTEGKKARKNEKSHDASTSTGEISPPDHPDDIGSFFEIRGRTLQGDFAADVALGPNPGLEPEEVWGGRLEKRWEGQQAKIKVEIVMGSMVLTGFLKGVLRKTKRDSAPTPSPGSKPTGITKPKPAPKAGRGKKSAARK